MIGFPSSQRFPGRGVAMLVIVLTLTTPLSGQACDTWTEETLPDSPGERTALRGATVLGPNNLWAVGHAREDLSGSYTHPISLHWNGVDWDAVPVPNPAHPLQPDSWLFAVDGSAADDIWAVGEFIHPVEFDPEPLTMHWNGSSWEYVPTITQPNGQGADFIDVAVIASDDVWAVGGWPGDPPPGGVETIPLAAHWDGSQWTSHFVPFDIDETNWEDTRLNGISALASDDIWAIGTHQLVLQVEHTPLITRWNGTSWETFNPLPPPDYLGALDIEALAADDVWVTCKKLNPDDMFDPFIVYVHWDGTGWTEFASPGGTYSTASVYLRANASDDLYAVSAHNVSHWNGMTWTVVAQAVNPPEWATIVDVVQAGPCGVQGVGWAGVASAQRVLSMRLDTSTPAGVAGGSIGAREGIVGAYPNPFNPRTRLLYALDQSGFVELTIHNAAGRQVAQLVQRPLQAGRHEVSWDGRSDNGISVATGTYFARLRTETGQASWKLILAK